MTKKIEDKKVISVVLDRPDFSPALRSKGIVHNMPICPLPWDIFGVIK